MAGKPKKDGKLASEDMDDEETPEEQDEDERERVTPREAGIGFIILGSMVLLVALIMPFVLGTSTEFAWGLSSQVLVFGIIGLAALGIGALLLNFKRLSRKL